LAEAGARDKACRAEAGRKAGWRRRGRGARDKGKGARLPRMKSAAAPGWAALWNDGLW